MTIYINDANREVSLRVPVTAQAGTLDVVVYDGDTEVYDVPTVSSSQGRYYFTMPFFLSNQDKVYRVHWKFNYSENSVNRVFETDTYVDVVTPILPLDEIKEIHPVATDREVLRIEKAVRTIIQAHTGQTFGKAKETKSVVGKNSDSLELPARLISLNAVNNVTENINNYYVIESNGWTLRKYSWGVPPVKADYYGLHQHVGGVIHNPNSVKLAMFGADATYKIDGLWGWLEVPEAVQEAARLLINDYACGDINYRDRYLTSMTAADWRIQFHSGAFLKTGNVRADQLLSDYVLKHGWAVL